MTQFPLITSTLAHQAADPFRLMVESVMDYAIYMLDPAGNVASWNSGAERIEGYRAEEIIGRHFSIFYPAADVAAGKPQQILQHTLAEGRTEEEGVRIRKDGTSFWAITTITPLFDHFNNHMGFAKVTRDITERRNAELALRESEERHRHLMEVMPDAVFINADEQIVYCNPAFVHLLGATTATELLDKPVLSIFHPSFHDVIRERITTMRAHDGVVPLIEEEVVRLNGDVIPVEVTATSIIHQGNLAILVVLRDLRQRKNIERWFRAMIEGVKDYAIYTTDPKGIITTWNDGATRIFGYTAEEALGRHRNMLFSANDVAVGVPQKELERAITLGSIHEERWRVRKDGTRFWAHSVITALRTDRGSLQGFVKVVRDLTELEQAEEEARQSQALLRIAGKAAHLGGYAFDIATEKLSWSDEICTIHDVPIGYQPTLAEGIAFYAPEYREQVANYVQACTTDGTPYDFECELITAKNRRIWVRAIGEPVRDLTGQVVGLQGAFQDISDRKRAEAEQQRLAAQIATTLESITDGFFTLDREWRVTYINTEAERMVRRTREELIGITVWEAFPETVGSIFEHEYRRAILENVTVVFEAYFPPLETWFGVRAYPSEQGLAVYFLDVTASRQAEQALRASEARFRTVIQSSWDVFHLVEADGRIMFESPAVTRVLGYQPEEMVGRNIIEFVHPDDLLNIREIVPDDRATLGRQRTIVLRVRHKDGSWRWVESFEVNLIEHPDVRAIAVNYRDITERREAEEALQLRDRAIQEVSQGILITDPNQPDNPIIYASAGVERITGYRSGELLGRNCRMFQGKETNQETVRTLREAIAAERACAVEILNYRKDGTPFWNALSFNPVRDNNGVLAYFVGVQNDVSEHKHLEAQLRQAQKMEAVGQLAGGVAHDFNNLLTIISGYSELILTMPDVDKHVYESISAINEAGERAAALTRQLLGFSRQTLLQPKVLDLNAVVAETSKMLHRLIGEDILFTTVLDPNLSQVIVDPGHLDQILMNLVINSRDAMPQGGQLTIETATVLLTAEYTATHLDCKPGYHVMLAITDTGVGMSPEVLSRIFEPFFTTKEVGKGTGLGLAMIFGIVQQSNGCIHVYSEPGHGTTFRIYFPAVTDPMIQTNNATATSGLHGSETILLVEDEESVRKLALMSLQIYGYTVLTAADGRDALRIMQTHDESIDLLLTDVVMPNLSGPELARAILAQFPHTKVLFMSGYTDDAIVRHGLLAAEVAFIQKPYTPLGLVRKVRHVLDD